MDYKDAFPGITRLELKVPVLASLKEAEGLILWMREKLLGAQPRRRSKKHLALAVFAAELRGEVPPGVK